MGCGLIQVMQIVFPIEAGAVVAIAINLVADLPVHNVVVIGDIGVLDPGRSLAGLAATVVCRIGPIVGGDHGLDACGNDKVVHPIVEGGIGGKVAAVVQGLVGSADEVEDISIRTARIAEYVDTGCLTLGGNPAAGQVIVIDRSIDAIGFLSNHRHRRAGIDADRCRCLTPGGNAGKE